METTVIDDECFIVVFQRSCHGQSSCRKFGKIERVAVNVKGANKVTKPNWKLAVELRKVMLLVAVLTS